MKALTALVFCAAALFAPSLLFAAGGGGEHAMTMSDILWDLGIKTLNVSILGFLAFKYLSGPLNRLVEARSDKVLAELEGAQSARKEAEERLRQFQEKTAGIEAEIEALRKQTCEDIDKEQKILLEEARKSADAIRQHVQDTIRQEVLKARSDLHREAGTLASQVAEDLVRKNIEDSDHKRLVGEYLKEMEATK